MNSVLRRFLFVCGLLSSSVSLLAQTSQTNGNVTGTVTDPTGAAIPGATVTLTDEATNIPLTTSTNAAGLYLFQNVNIGTYTLTVEKQGFRREVAAHQTVSTGTNLTLNLSLQIGATSETVEVKDVAGAELQTENATMGTSLGGAAVLQLPTISRDVSSLVFFQPTASPTFNGAEGNTTSGNIAGAFADQNTFMLDGGNNTSDLDGDNATYIGHNGAGVMPTPAESVEEFRVNTNNMSADFSMSSGGQVLITTKRGTEQFHGSAYDWFQGDWLNSNDWSNNFNGLPKPKGHFNRFGGALGGPMTPSVLGGKTYFYVNYEGQRFPRSGPFTATVPSNTLRNGIIQERDANGNVVQYNVAQYDPLGIGMSPVVSSIWSKYLPACNTLNYGDHGLNTCGFIGQLNFPLTNDFGVARIDHDFGSKWRFFSSYRYYRQPNPTTSQVDIGGLLSGDKFGVPAVASTTIDQPRYLVAGVTGTISPTLTNDFHFSYTRNQWQWLRAGAGPPQYPGLGAPVTIGGDTASALIPMNVNTQSARPRLWDGHDYDFRDNVTKLWGTHLIQFGGEFFPERWKFDRYDNVVGGLTQLIYQVSSSGVKFPGSVIPAGLPTNEVGSYKGYYADLLGLVSSTNVVVTRTGAQLQANPLGTPVHSNVSDYLWNVYFQDTWKIKPNFTLSYGLNYQIQYPPTEKHGVQDIMVYASNNQPVYLQDYLGNIQTAANAGQVYNPTLGWSPIGAVHGINYPYNPFWGEIQPRVSIAWTPDVKSGWLANLLGDKATVIRAGYSRMYGRNLGIDLVSDPVLGDGFLQPVSCANPNSSGACTGPSQVTPGTAFRIGPSGLVAPVGAITPTLPTPVVPGVNAPTAALLESLDGRFKPNVSDQIDVSIQRQFKGGVLLELGYVGVWSRNLYQGVEFSTVPWMMKQGGQTFANAYDNLFFQLCPGGRVLTCQPGAFTTQPFFEAALGGPNSAYCKGYGTCTAAVVANEGPAGTGNITGNYVGSLWSDLDGSFVFGPSNPMDSGQCSEFCYGTTSFGYSNYNALTVSMQKRSTNWTMLANFTYGHALGVVGLNQAYTFNSVNDPWNLGVDYGPQYFDRKFTLNVLGSYSLPFGKGQKFDAGNRAVNEIIGGWVVSPIFSYGSGLPLTVFTGSFQEWGVGINGDSAGCSAVPINPGMSYGNAPVFNASITDPTIGANGLPANGGSGVFMFSNPAAVFNNFRPNLVGYDGRCTPAGTLRGQQRWNLDLGLTKDLPITERLGIQIYAQAFNVFNHMQWGDPSLNLQDPADFGALNGQYGALALGNAPGANPNYTRIIQLGVRIHF
jgi:hypothetical protein